MSGAGEIKQSVPVRSILTGLHCAIRDRGSAKRAAAARRDGKCLGAKRLLKLELNPSRLTIFSIWQ